MPQHLQKDSLLIISDTSAFYRNGQCYAFEPMVREVTALAGRYKITWLTCRLLEKDLALCPVDDKEIEVVVMPSVRHRYFNWFFVLLNYPVFAYYILKHAVGKKYIHTRGPSHPALIGVLASRLTDAKMVWHKYAGNWHGKYPPLSYRLQRWLLLKSNQARNIVTVNGEWDDVPAHVVGFENPCMYEQERLIALKAEKNMDNAYRLLFVGNLDDNKGILKLLEAVALPDFPTAIGELIIVGDGRLKDEVLEILESISKVNVSMVGLLNRSELNRYYNECHFLILPSKSEGFPKVIAEAAAYGCIPIVTNISAIGQHIQHAVNGYLMPDNNPDTIIEALNMAVRLDYRQVSNNVRSLASGFTYEHYVKRVCTILS